MDSPRLMRRLRAAFDARVFNHGAYNLVYGQPSGTSMPLVIGYRHSPLEMVLCRVDPRFEGAPPTDGEPVVTVDLHNIATAADTGSGYQVETVTGYRTWFEVSDHARVPVGDLTDDGVAELDQSEDAADFHGFMTALMDELDRLYEVPPTPDEGGADADLRAADGPW